jgi:hypothetical protein
VEVRERERGREVAGWAGWVGVFWAGQVGPRERRKREGEEIGRLGWFGMGEGKSFVFLTQTPFEDSRRFEDDGRR